MNFAAPDYAADQADIERRRRYADMLRQQSMQPLESQTAGGWVIPTSPLQGIAKLVQAYSGRKGLEEADSRQKALGEKISGDASSRLAQALKMYQGTPGQTLSLPGNEMGDDPTQATIAAQKADPAAAAALLQGNPMTAPYAQSLVAQMLKGPESRFGKVDAKDYSPESIIKFNASGNYADLVPIRKKEFVDTGGAQVAVDPYAAQVGASLQKGNSPDALLRNNTDLFKWSNINPYQAQQLGIDKAGLGLRAQQVGFEAARLRDEGVLGGNGGMAPKDQRALAKETAVDQAKMNVKREFNMGGLNNAIDEAEKILKTGKPTESYIGAGIDAAGTVIGVGSKSGAMADQLKSISGTLVATMPRMEGPQSDKDVQLYREMAGSVGDNTMPISRRLAALKTVRELYGKYEKQQGAGSGLKFLGFE